MGSFQFAAGQDGRQWGFVLLLSLQRRAADDDLPQLGELAQPFEQGSESGVSCPPHRATP